MEIKKNFTNGTEKPLILDSSDKGRDTIPEKKPIGEEEVTAAFKTLMDYKSKKASLENRILEEDKWFKMRHWDFISKEGDEKRPKPTSAWLFNAIANKHADAMDNYPEPNILPREQSDEQDAKSLSSIIPVLLERAEFEQVYSDAWWYKLKHGFAIYGVTWDNALEDGLGDISISLLDALNVFFEPGISDIQCSKNLFIVSLVDTDYLAGMYPSFADSFASGNSFDIKKYDSDMNDYSDKSLVVDWYYIKNINGKRVLHYVKFSGTAVLFATENEEYYKDRGLYDHGKYPVVFDVLFPEASAPYGFGLISIMKSPQMYIDKLDQLLLENAAFTARPRYFSSHEDGINEEEFLNLNNTIVHVEGDVSENRLKEISVPTIGSYAMNMIQYKVQELKETSSNNDATSGSATSGVTSGAAIAALQEAGNKQSRDMIAASYRAYSAVCCFMIELIRQFYTEERSFRITGSDGQPEFIRYSNRNITARGGSASYIGQPREEYENLSRRPVFDIAIKPQKRSAYSKLSQNNLAKEMYQMGFFNPELATQALCCIDMMDFDGKEKIKSQIGENNALYGQIQSLTAQLKEQAELISRLTGENIAVDENKASSAPSSSGASAQEELGYGERLVKNASVSMGE